MPNQRNPFLINAYAIRKAIKSAINQRRTASGQQRRNNENHSPRGERQSRIKAGRVINVVLAAGTIVTALAAVFQANEIRNEFAIANTPYLQFEYFYDSIAPGKNPVTAYQLVNLSKVPCKIQWIQISDSFDYHLIVNSPLGGTMQVSPYGTSFSIPFPASSKINMYSIDNSPYKAIYTSKWSLDIPGLDSLIKAGVVSHYIYANVFYTNLMAHRAYVYQFTARIIRNPPGGLEMLDNENAPAD